MKLVIESAHVREVTMEVAGIELPLTREQVVKMLFGEEYEIVRTGSGGATAKRSAATTTDPGKRGREPSGYLQDVVCRVLGSIGEASIHEIRAGVEREHPGIFADKCQEYLAGGLARFVVSKVLRRVGSKGAFRYSLAKGAPKSTSPAASAPSADAPKSWGEKSVADVVIEVLSRRAVPIHATDVQELVVKRHPGILEDRSPSLLSTTLSSLKTRGLLKVSEVAGRPAYALVKGWDKVLAKREKAATAKRVANGKALSDAYQKKLAAGKVKGKKPKAKAKKGRSGTQLEMGHLNGAAPAARASTHAEAAS